MKMVTAILDLEHGYVSGLVCTEYLSFVQLSPRNPYIHCVKVPNNMSVGDYETILTNDESGTTCSQARDNLDYSW